MKLEAEAWVMSDATTPAERIAYYHWMMNVHLLVGNNPNRDKVEAIGKAFDALEPKDQQALLALSDRVPPTFGFPKFMQPTPGAAAAHD